MFQTISMSQMEMFLEQGKPVTLLDVRTEEEFLQGHLDGAVNIPLEDLEMKWPVLSKERTIVVYCAHGGRSLMAARLLERNGFSVINTAGGLAAYRGKHFEKG